MKKRGGEDRWAGKKGTHQKEENDLMHSLSLPTLSKQTTIQWHS